MNRIVLVVLLVMVVPYVGAVQFTVVDNGNIPPDPNTITTHDVISQFTPSSIVDNCFPYVYGGKCRHTITTNFPISSCRFGKQNCEITSNRTFVISYPKNVTDVPNTPSFILRDNGTICFGNDADDCLPYNMSMTVYNFNWRVESDTGTSIWVFVSPNGYNVIPILLFVTILYVLWHYQNAIEKRVREL